MDNVYHEDGKLMLRIGLVKEAKSWEKTEKDMCLERDR